MISELDCFFCSNLNIIIINFFSNIVVCEEKVKEFFIKSRIVCNVKNRLVIYAPTLMMLTVEKIHDMRLN